MTPQRLLHRNRSSADLIQFKEDFERLKHPAIQQLERQTLDGGPPSLPRSSLAPPPPSFPFRLSLPLPPLSPSLLCPSSPPSVLFIASARWLNHSPAASDLS